MVAVRLAIGISVEAAQARTIERRDNRTTGYIGLIARKLRPIGRLSVQILADIGGTQRTKFVANQGDAVVEIDGQEHTLTTFDTTYVDAGVPHRFRNASDTEPMRILWIYGSIDATRTILDTGVTTRVDAEHNRPA